VWLPLDRAGGHRFSSRGDRCLSPGESDAVDEQTLIYVEPPGATGPPGDNPPQPEDDGRFRVVIGIDDPIWVQVFTVKIRHALQGTRELVVEHLIHGEDILALTTARRVHLGLLMIHHLTWRGALNKPFAQRLQVCARVVQQLRHVARAPVLVLSGLNSAEVRAQMLQAGATDFILMPNDFHRLEDLVHAEIARLPLMNTDNMRVGPSQVKPTDASR
jgi:DNA-binding NarL/FixJ family response regulator